jgi:hypothetical protein
MMDSKQQQRRGWGKPYDSKKWHYFEGMMALCGRWIYGGPLDKDDVLDSPDNCAACVKKRARQLQSAGTE